MLNSAPRVPAYWSRVMSVVVRFAPSPTGFLHIGGARTALFNWLYRQASRRQVPAAHRGHRSGAFDQGSGRRHHRRAALAGARLGRRDRLPVRRAARHAEIARQLLAEGKAYNCYCTAGGARRRCASGSAPRAADPLRRHLARPRSDRGAAGRPAGDPPEGAADRRDDDPRPCPGRGHRRQRAARRSDHPARRRHADLQSLGGGRRPRHGDHPCHSRRRSPQQRLPPDPDLSRARLGCPGIRPCAADPRAGRRQAFEAPRRARGRCLSRHGLSARGAAQLPAAARLGPWRRRDHLDRRRRSNGSTSMPSAARRPASISPSSTTSTAITSRRHPTRPSPISSSPLPRTEDRHGESTPPAAPGSSPACRG